MKIALGVEYDGKHYSGWQRQPNRTTVQGRVEQALSAIADHPVDCHCAGRTDAGVHATGQIVHFETEVNRDMSAWTLGMNSKLPPDIAIRWAQPVDNDFHARHTATARRYRYIICNQRLRPGILSHGVSHYHEPLNVDLMNQAAPALLGENDFTSFRATYCQARTPFRNIIHLNISRQNQYVIIDVKANAFLHHMVRNITGCLIAIGKGEYPPEWLEEVLKAKDRTKADVTAKPNGLYMVEVDYPSWCNIPKAEIGPLFLPDS